MLRTMLTLTSSALVAALAIVTVDDTDAATAGAADIELSADPAMNMTWPIGPVDPWELPPDPIGPPPKPPCQPIWTCDWETWYPTRAACGAVCGGGANCAQDFNCDGSCICQ